MSDTEVSGAMSDTEVSGAMNDAQHPAPAHLEHDFAPPPGETYTRTYTVRAGDVDFRSRLRLDGIARYLQDIGIDDLEASGFADIDPLWIVRRAVLDVHADGTLPEEITLHRWCAALSTRWTHMRVSIHGDHGAHIETEAFWIHVSAEKGVPARISDDGLALLERTAHERRLKWKPWLTEPAPPASGSDVVFPLRFADIDPFEHVNNAVYWEAVEQVLTDDPALLTTPYRAVIEYNKPIQLQERVVVRRRRVGAVLMIWFVVDDDVRTVVRVGPRSALDLPSSAAGG